MFNLIKRTLIAAIVIAAVAAPTAAFASLKLDPAGRMDPAFRAASQAIPHTRSQETPTAARRALVPSSGFQWADAGLGAAGVLVLITIGSGTAVAVRRRTRPLAS